MGKRPSEHVCRAAHQAPGDRRVTTVRGGRGGRYPVRTRGTAVAWRMCQRTAVPRTGRPATSRWTRFRFPGPSSSSTLLLLEGLSRSSSDKSPAMRFPGGPEKAPPLVASTNVGPDASAAFHPRGRPLRRGCPGVPEAAGGITYQRRVRRRGWRDIHDERQRGRTRGGAEEEPEAEEERRRGERGGGRGERQAAGAAQGRTEAAGRQRQ